MSNTKHLTDLVKVCSILPALVVMPAMAEQVHIGTGVSQTLTGKHLDAVDSDGALYFLKSADSQNLASLVVDGATLSNVTSLYKSGHGVGVITGYENSKIVVKNSEFSGNQADYYAAIFAVAPEGDIKGGDLTITDSKFLRNEALDGAAIGAMHTTRMTNVLFEGNKATSGAGNSDGGGALFLGAVSQTTLTDVTFKNNSSAAMGGAISMRSAEEGNNSKAKLDIFESEFTDNTASTNGGAIYSTFYDSETVKDSVYINDTDFSLNSANNGGAIYTEGLADLGGGFASMKIVDADFENNTATVYGGAIYNASAMILDDVTFVGNHADQVGGAILLYNGSDTTIYNALFDTNTAGWGGALYTTTGMKNLTITNTIFRNNSAKGTGGAGIYKHATLTDVTFDNNKATDKNGMGGGAMSLGAEAHLVLNTKASESNVFTGNKSETFGGAISTRDFVNGNNADAYLDIVNTKFAGNTAGKEGGAIDNYFYHSAKNADAVYLANSVFSGNSAANGGAVYNHGAESAPENKGGQSAQRASIDFDGVTFTGNTASVAGGAIYNETEANVFLSGNNTFTGNTANGVANDIYNDGTLTIASGMTSIDGGITGNGALDIKSGATLNMNYASIEQGTINLDGTLMASLLNDKDVVDITGALSGTGTVLLSAGATGTYDVSLFADANLGVDFGKTYDVEFNDDKTKATLTARDAQSIAADTGASIAAAGAVSGLAASTDATIQQVSLRAQAALNNGDIALVEKEMAKANPDTKPVSQSVAASVQNQVVTMAAGRMSAIGGGATGRAGGDVTGAGVWTQGMFNKSKFADKFHGYTRGFAIGGDTLIDNVLTIGGGYAFSNSDIHADGRNMDVENNSIFMYAQYKPAAWYVNATLNYTKSDYADVSTVFGYLLNDEYETKSYGAQAMFGYDFANGVTPEFGMRYLHVSQEDHVDVMNREIAGMDADFLSGVAGLKYAFTIESDSAVKFSPTMRAAMTYDFLSDDATATVVVPGASAYYVDVDRLSRLGGEFGIGLTAEYRGLEISLNYELDLHQDYTSQTGLLKFRYDF